MNDAAQLVLRTLELSQQAKDQYASSGENEGWGQVFGGQLIAQSLCAARLAQTDSKQIISLHLSFLSRGDLQSPFKFQIKRLQDGNSFARVQVVASQREEMRTTANITFQNSVAGLEHQAGMPDAPQSARIPPQPVEMRFVNPERLLQPGGEVGNQMIWVRFSQTLDADPELHKAILGYMSDQSIAHVALQPHALGAYNGKLSLLSLDHSIAFHRPLSADRWLLYVRTCDSLFGGRALVIGSFFSQDGTLVASIVQNSYIRIRE